MRRNGSPGGLRARGRAPLYPQRRRVLLAHSIEAINEGAGILALDGDILYANQQLAEILGAPLERLVGTCSSDSVEAADRELFMALLEHGRQSATLDHSLRHQGEHRILYEFYKELIKLRNEIRAGAGLSKDRLEVVCLERERTLVVRR